LGARRNDPRRARLTAIVLPFVNSDALLFVRSFMLRLFPCAMFYVSSLMCYVCLSVSTAISLLSLLLIHIHFLVSFCVVMRVCRPIGSIN